jgi:hypothetical protein
MGAKSDFCCLWDVTFCTHSSSENVCNKNNHQIFVANLFQFFLQPFYESILWKFTIQCMISFFFFFFSYFFFIYMFCCVFCIAGQLIFTCCSLCIYSQAIRSFHSSRQLKLLDDNLDKSITAHPTKQRERTNSPFNSLKYMHPGLSETIKNHKPDVFKVLQSPGTYFLFFYFDHLLSGVFVCVCLVYACFCSCLYVCMFVCLYVCMFVVVCSCL